MAFPTLSSAPISCPEEPIDDTITSKSEGGYKQTRPRNTRQLRKYSPKYILSEADWQALKTHDSQVGGWTIFAWTPPGGASINVRYTTRPKAEPFNVGNGTKMYNVDFVVEMA